MIISRLFANQNLGPLFFSKFNLSSLELRFIILAPNATGSSSEITVNTFAADSITDAQAIKPVGKKIDEVGGRTSSSVQNSGLNISNSMYKLEIVLRTCYQNYQTKPDYYGIIRRNPKVESNPLLCNLMKPQETQNTGDELKQIIVGLFSKITEHQIPNGPIRGICSNRVGRFNLTECEMIRQRIIAIQNESEHEVKPRHYLQGKCHLTRRDERLY